MVFIADDSLAINFNYNSASSTSLSTESTDAILVSREEDRLSSKPVFV